MLSVVEIKFFEWDDTDKNEWNETNLIRIFRFVQIV